MKNFKKGMVIRGSNWPDLIEIKLIEDTGYHLFSKQPASSEAR